MSDWQPIGPIGHVLLGAKIALSAFLFLGGFWLISVGFNCMSRAFDRVLDGLKYQRILVALWFGVSLLGATLISSVVTYWLNVNGPA